MRGTRQEGHGQGGGDPAHCQECQHGRGRIGWHRAAVARSAGMRRRVSAPSGTRPQSSEADHARRRVPLQREKRTDPAALHIAGARGERYHPAGRARHNSGVHSGAETAAPSPRSRSAEVIRRLDRALPGRVTVKWFRYAWAILAVAVAAAFGAPTAALAEDYPIRPLRLVVVTAAGGLMDVAARVTADYVGKALGQSIVIENRPGGGGNLGAEAVAKAPPDGYTIGLIQLGNVAINPHVYADMTFDPLNDLVPVAPVTSSPILVVANAKVAANDLRELIALAKQSPGKLSYGSGGPGTAPHLAGEMFKGLAGVDILHVP